MKNRFLALLAVVSLALFAPAPRAEPQSPPTNFDRVQRADGARVVPEKFLRDWGPGPNGPDLATIGLTDSEECNDAVMVTVRVNANRVEQLWLDRSGDSISFAPFPICPQQIPYEIMVHRTLGKLRKVLLQ